MVGLRGADRAAHHDSTVTPAASMLMAMVA